MFRKETIDLSLSHCVTFPSFLLSPEWFYWISFYNTSFSCIYCLYQMFHEGYETSSNMKKIHQLYFPSIKVSQTRSEVELWQLIDLHNRGTDFQAANWSLWPPSVVTVCSRERERESWMRMMRRLFALIDWRSCRKGELVRLDEIERVYKKRRHDKNTRLATVLVSKGPCLDFFFYWKTNIG